MSAQRTLIGLTALAILVMELLLAQTTYACSAGPDFNPVAEADLIVGGRVTAWEMLPAGQNSPFTPIRLTMDVDQRFKGEAGDAVRFIDLNSLSLSNGQEVWLGSSGACGAFDGDPTGQYMVLGLDTAPDGAYVSNLMLRFFSGAEPSGDAYERAVSRLTALSQQLTPTAEPATPTNVTPPAAVTPQQPTPEPLAPTASPPPPTATATEAPEATAGTPPIPALLLGVGAAVAGLAAITLAGRRRR